MKTPSCFDETKALYMLNVIVVGTQLDYIFQIRLIKCDKKWKLKDNGKSTVTFDTF